MKKYDILSIGHISLDYNIDCHDNQIVEIGGAVIYSSAAAYAAGKRAAVLTKLSPTDKERLHEFVLPEEDVYYIPSAKSTSIRNQYFTENKEKRLCTCLSQAEGFTFADIPDIDCKIYHLAGLIRGDFDGKLMRQLASKGKVAVDVQALLRCANGDNTEMYFEDWQDKLTYLPYVDFLKTDAAEAEILTGESDRYKAAEILYGWGAKEIVITHNTEVICYDGTDFYACPIKARNLSGRSGRGDTTFAAYLAERLDKSSAESLLFATATVSAKMEHPGPYRGNRASIEQYISDFYQTEDLQKI